MKKNEIMSKTKIVCTVGPASESKEMLTKLVKAGMNVMRLNFSHGTHEEHAEKITTLLEINKELSTNVAILLDTKGPEIRTGDFVGGKTSFKKGHKPWNKKEVGSERTDVEGYILVKVDEPSVWKLKHRIMYEKYHNVKLTQDDVIIFADQNKSNLEKDNLILITKNQLLKMNQDKLIFNDKELTKTGVNIAKLIIKTKEKMEGKKENE